MEDVTEDDAQPDDILDSPFPWYAFETDFDDDTAPKQWRGVTLPEQWSGVTPEQWRGV